MKKFWMIIFHYEDDLVRRTAVVEGDSHALAIKEFKRMYSQAVILDSYLYN